MVNRFVSWFILVFLLFFAPLTVTADSPAPQRDYTVVTENGSFIFVMLARPNDPFSAYNQAGIVFEDKKIRNKYTESGLYLNDGSNVPLWTVDWYAFGVEVSSDGEHLVKWGPWPFSPNYRELALAFYENGQLVKQYRVNDLVAETDKLPQTVSHYEWLEKSHYDDALGQLSVTTINGEQYLFDIVNGAILEESIVTQETAQGGELDNPDPIATPETVNAPIVEEPKVTQGTTQGEDVDGPDPIVTSESEVSGGVPLVDMEFGSIPVLFLFGLITAGLIIVGSLYFFSRNQRRRE